MARRSSLCCSAALLVAFLAAAARAAPAPPLHRDFWIPNQGALDMVVRDGEIYLAGGFSYVGPYTGNIAPLDLASGEALASPGAHRSLGIMKPDGQGGWYLAPEVGGSPGTLLHLRSDYTFSDWAPSYAGGVNSALAVNDSTVFLGGGFGSVNGESRAGLAAVHARTGELLPLAPPVEGAVYALAVADQTLFIGGSFHHIGGLPRENLAAVDLSTGEVTAWSPGADHVVSQLLVHGGALYVGGSFSTIAGIAHEKTAAFDLASGSILPWRADLSPNAYLIKLEAIGPRIYLDGFLIAQVNGQWTDMRPLHAVDATTGDLLAWNPGLTGEAFVYDMSAHGSTLYVAGDLRGLGADERYYAAGLDAETAEVLPWNPNPPGWVFLLSATESAVLAHGDFETLGGDWRRGLAAIRESTGRPTDWGPSAAGLWTPYLDLEIDDGFVYAGGHQYHSHNFGFRGILKGLPRDEGAGNGWVHILALNGRTVVRALALQDSTLFVGGRFATIGPPRESIAAVLTRTGEVLPWNPGVEGDVWDLEAASNLVYVGGEFTAVGGLPRNNLAAVDASTGVVTAWDPDVDGVVRDILLAHGAVHIAGDFTTVGGHARAHVAAVDPISAEPTAWDPSADGPVLRLAERGSRIYAGGDFQHIGGRSRAYVAALDTGTGSATSWDPRAGDTVTAIAPSDGRVYISGSFNTVLGETRRRFAALGAFSAESAPVWEPPASPRAGTHGELDLRVTSPARSPLSVAFTLGRTGLAHLRVFDVHGREVASLLDGPVGTGRSTVTWDGTAAGHHAAAGVYFVRLETTAGAVTRRVVLLR